MSFFDLPDPQFQLTPEAQLPQPQFRAGNGQPQITAGTGGRNPYRDFLMRNRPQTGATLPAVYNGGQQQAADDNPVRSDVVTALGGRGGQMPSLQQFLASMPQTQSVSFSSGGGRINNGLNIGGHIPSGDFTPATQGPTQASDHTNAGMAAFGNILGQYTTGPESPTQRLARTNAALNETLRTQAQFGGPNSLEQQRIDNQLELAERERERDLMRYAAGQNEAGKDWATINTDTNRLRAIGGVGSRGTGSRDTGNRPVNNATTAPVFNQGATPAGSAPGAATPNANPGITLTPQEQAEAELSRVYRDSLLANGIRGEAGAQGRAGEPMLPQGYSDPVRSILSNFVNSVPDSHLQTPEAINRLNGFLIQKAGQDRVNQWFRENTNPESVQRRAIQRMILARNRLDPNNPIGIQPSVVRRAAMMGAEPQFSPVESLRRYFFGE